MFVTWFKKNILFPDPGLVQLTYSIRVLVITFATLLLCRYVLHVPALWPVMVAFFMAQTQIDVGYTTQMKKLFLAGLLCLIYIFIGALVGFNHWWFGLLILILGAVTYQAARFGLPAFFMLVMPLVFLIISSVYPLDLAGAWHRSVISAFGIVVLWVLGALLFPYRCNRVLNAIEQSIIDAMMQYFNWIFLASITGYQRTHERTVAHQTIVNLLVQMNQVLLNKDSSKVGSRAKLIYNIFAQGYFIARLLNEPERASSLVNRKAQLESVRHYLQQLLLGWQKKEIKTVDSLIKASPRNCLHSDDSVEMVALSRSIDKIEKSVGVLVACEL